MNLTPEFYPGLPDTPCKARFEFPLTLAGAQTAAVWAFGHAEGYWFTGERAPTTASEEHQGIEHAIWFELEGDALLFKLTQP